MSRTYRRASGKDRYMIVGKYGVLREFSVPDFRDYYLDINSKEARRKIRSFQSDNGCGWMDFRGPSWFIRDFIQVPHRMHARQELVKWMRNPEYEVIIPAKPKRDVYWL